MQLPQCPPHAEQQHACSATSRALGCPAARCVAKLRFCCCPGPSRLLARIQTPESPGRPLPLSLTGRCLLRMTRKSETAEVQICLPSNLKSSPFMPGWMAGIIFYLSHFLKLFKFYLDFNFQFLPSSYRRVYPRWQLLFTCLVPLASPLELKHCTTAARSSSSGRENAPGQ